MSSFKIRVFVFLCFLLPALYSGAQNTFYKTYGTNNDDIIYNLHRCADGGYYMMGRTKTSAYRSDAFIIRTDSLGNVLWDKIIQFDSSSVNFAGSGILPDESMVLIFTEYNYFTYQPTTTLLKLNSAGDSLWTKQLFATNLCCIDEPLIPLSNGEFLLAGRYQFFMGEQYYGYLSRIDSSGNIISSIKFNADYDEVFLNAFTLTPGNEVVMVGSLMEHISTHPQHSFLIKTDLNCNFVSGEIYMDTVGVNIYEIIANADQTYTMLCGGNKLLKTDTSGTIFLSRTNAGSDFAYSITPSPDSGYFISGISYSSPGFSAGLAKTNDIGDTIWTKKYLAWPAGAGFSVDPIDKSITFASATDTITNSLGGSDGMVMRLDSSGTSACYTDNPFSIHFQTTINSITGFDSIYNYWAYGFESTPPSNHQITFISGIINDTVCFAMDVMEVLTEKQFNLYPNPVPQNHFQLRSVFQPRDLACVELISVEGKTLAHWILREHNRDKLQYNFTLPDFISNGIYLLRVTSSQEDLQVLKMIVAR